MDQVIYAALVNELSKIAEDKKPKGHAGAAALAGLGAGTAANLTNMHLGGALDRSFTAEHNLPGRAELLEQIQNKATIPIIKNPDTAAAYGGGVYMRNPERAQKILDFLPEMMRGGQSFPGKGPTVYVGEKVTPSILSHELGHAASDKGILRPAQGALGGLGMRAPIVSLGAGYASGRYTDSPGKGALLAGGIPLALATPTLLAEAAASVRGFKNLKSLGASPAALSLARRSLMTAGGTYGVKAVGNASTGMLGYGLGRWRRNKAIAREENKLAAALEFEKVALLERLVRLGATDIPTRPACS